MLATNLLTQRLKKMQTSHQIPPLWEGPKYNREVYLGARLPRALEWFLPDVRATGLVSFDVEQIIKVGKPSIIILGSLQGKCLLIRIPQAVSQELPIKLPPELCTLLSSNLVLGCNLHKDVDMFNLRLPYTLDVLQVSKEITFHPLCPWTNPKSDGSPITQQHNLKHVPMLAFGQTYKTFFFQHDFESFCKKYPQGPLLALPTEYTMSKLYNWRGTLSEYQRSYARNDSQSPFIHLMVRAHLALAAGELEVPNDSGWLSQHLDSVLFSIAQEYASVPLPRVMELPAGLQQCALDAGWCLFQRPGRYCELRPTSPDLEPSGWPELSPVDVGTVEQRESPMEEGEPKPAEEESVVVVLEDSGLGADLEQSTINEGNIASEIVSDKQKEGGSPPLSPTIAKPVDGGSPPRPTKAVSHHGDQTVKARQPGRPTESSTTSNLRQDWNQRREARRRDRVRERRHPARGGRSTLRSRSPRRRSPSPRTFKKALSRLAEIFDYGVYSTAREPDMNDVPNRFREYPIFRNQCCVCGRGDRHQSADRCGYFREQVAQHRLRFSTWPQYCKYPQCDSRGTHKIQHCPNLHRRCPLCKVRGHASSFCNLSEETKRAAYLAHMRFGQKSKKGIKQPVSKVVRGPVLPEEHGTYDNQWSFRPSLEFSELPTVLFEGKEYKVDWKPSTVETFNQLPDRAEDNVDCKAWWLRREIWK